jgi:hypothetical protein
MEQYPAYLKQVLKDNPKKKNQIMEFLKRFTLIEDIIVDKEIFKHTFKCTFPGCGLCCFAGTRVSQKEINRMEPVIDEIKLNLSKSKVKRLDKLGNSFYIKFRGRGYKLRTWNGSCIFLMEDKRCAVHKYCIDKNIDWINFHFDLCVTYPLSINTSDGVIQIEEELYKGEYVYHCFKKKKDVELDLDNDLVYYMKDVIIHRFGNSFWKKLEKRYLEKSW